MTPQIHSFLLKNLRVLTPGLCTALLLLCSVTYGQDRGQTVFPTSRAVVNMAEVERLQNILPQPLLPVKGTVPNKQKIAEPANQLFSPAPPEGPVANAITAPSPTPVFNYEAAPDEAQGGGTAGTYNIPPDTYGAVGLDKVMVTVNNNYKILNKTTGAQISLVSMPNFWSSLGADGAGAFDPRVIYDPYNNRWLLAAVSNGGTGASRVLIGISQTHDPSGSYWLFAFDPDAGTTNWADYPVLGFNKNWVAVSNNMFGIASGTFVESKMFVLNYPSLLTGTATATTFTTATQSTIHPAETFSATEETLYMVSHNGSASATYRFHTITGTAAAPVATFAAVNQIRTGGGWVQPTGNNAPQQCLSSCPVAALSGLDIGDSRISGNVVFRNGSIWYAQTAAFGSPFTRTAAQWTRINTAGVFQEGGRVEVPTATATNGEQWYTYPSLAVNASNDMVIGYTKTESDGYAGAGYSLRYSTDAAGTTNDPVIYKDGEDTYSKDFGSGRNRWGDYSHTLVDPLDDASFLTIQEYAKLRAAPTIGGSNSKWGTWIAKVAPNPCLSNVASTGNWNTAGTWSTGVVPAAANHVSIMSGDNITLDVDPTAASITVNQGATLTVASNRTINCKLIIYGTLNITGGRITIGNNDVFLSEAATITGASSTSYFVTNGTGTVSKIIPAGGSFTFPVAPNTTSYNGLTIANTAGPIEVFSVRVSAGVTPSATNNAACVQRTWNISEMTTGNNTATLTFRWAAAEHGASFTGTSGFAYRHNGTSYVLRSALTTPVLSSGIYSASTVTGITSFSPWIVANSGTLPIIMEYFTGQKTSNDQHLLSWKAQCTGPTSNFELQRSSDGQQFTTINAITTDDVRCQSPFGYTDASPLNGKNFYRLMIRDENGKISYSNIVVLIHGKSGFAIVGVQPNPVAQDAKLNLSAATKQVLNIYITDSKGSRVMQFTTEVLAGMNQKNLNVGHLSQGTYLITVVSKDNEQQTIRFIKQ